MTIASRASKLLYGASLLTLALLKPARADVTFTTLVDLDSTLSSPIGPLIEDSSGNLIGTSQNGGIFEVSNDGGGTYSASTIATVYGDPFAGVIADAAGNLYGTTLEGGSGNGTVFTIAKTSSGYASTAQTLVTMTSNNQYQYAGLTPNGSGNLYGVSLFGPPGTRGSIYQVSGSPGAGYTLTTLATMSNATAWPNGTLVADAAGDLFGVSRVGNTVFELVRNPDGSYQSSLQIVASLSDGSSPVGGLAIDSHGDLFGTAQQGGANGFGTVFEVTAAQVASALAGSGPADPTSIMEFDNVNGSYPISSLIVDAAGDVFGTAQGDVTQGAYQSWNGTPPDYGTVFEIPVAGAGAYGSPIVLHTFDGTDGMGPQGGLYADGAGNIYGTTSAGGPDFIAGYDPQNAPWWDPDFVPPVCNGEGCGTVFEISGAGFVPDATTSDVPSPVPEPTPIALVMGAAMLPLLRRRSDR